MRPTNRLTWLIAIIAALLLAACGGATEPTDAPEETEPTEADGGDVETLTIGLLPVLDSLPYYIAVQEGYFADEGVEVEVVPVASPVERNNLMQAGEIDAMLTELSTTAIFNQQETQIQIVITARQATEDGPVFRVLAAPDSGLETPEDLAGVPIAVSENTIIEYVTTRLLQEEAGLAAEDIQVQGVPSIPERFQLLMSGDLQAATLPDPLAQSAIEQGAVLIIDDSANPFFTVTGLAFSTETLENNGEAVERFLRAWDRAVASLNEAPEDYRELFIEEVNVPPNVEATYDIPEFPRSEIPTEEQWNDTLSWLQDKGLLEGDVSYADSVTGDFLPEGD